MKQNGGIKMDVSLSSKNLIQRKPFNTYTGLALLDEYGEVVDKSMFSDSIKVGVGNSMQINWNIEIIE